MDIQIGDIYKLDNYIYTVIEIYEVYCEVEYIEQNGNKAHKPINNKYLKTGKKLNL
jgi:hypothetical protein